VDYDLTRLTQLGRRRKRLLDQIEELRREITPEILAAHAANVGQKTIAEVSHYTRDTVRQICLTPEQRQAEREARWQRTRKSTR
jgi:hypothetical protein